MHFHEKNKRIKLKLKVWTEKEDLGITLKSYNGLQTLQSNLRELTLIRAGNGSALVLPRLATNPEWTEVCFNTMRAEQDLPVRK